MGGDSGSDDSSSDGSSSGDSSSDDANCIVVAHWGKCAGGGMTGRCCAEGLQCYKFSEWYSQCLTSCPSGWECSGGRRRNLRGAFRKLVHGVLFFTIKSLNTFVQYSIHNIHYPYALKK